MKAAKPATRPRPDPRAIATVDDDVACREAVRLSLAPTGRAVVPYETARGALTALRDGSLAPLVLMDMSLPGESAHDAIAAMRRSGRLVVALTSHQRADFVFDALRAGAVGYVLKQDALAELASVVDVVERGGSPLTPSVARRVLAAFAEGGGADKALSTREEEILRCFADGRTYAESATELSISVDTVREHVRRMYDKLQVRSRSEAVVAAFKRGILR